MNHTQNYQLSQWEMSDRIQMEDFNNDNAKIEAALKAQADAIAARATKAELQAETAARTGDVAALNAAVAKLGNCILYTSSYVGTGVNQLMTLTFPKPPILVYVGAPSGGYHIVAVSGMTFYQGGTTNERYNLTWSGNSFSWQNGMSAIVAMNAAGETNTVVALLDAES